MSFRREHSKLRPQPPRLKDLKRRERNGERSRNHGPRGLFTAKNDAARNRAFTALVKRHLGADATGEQAKILTKETLVTYRACLRALGTPGRIPQVQDTVARRSRWSTLSAHYALLAAEKGLGTEAGDAALEMALKLDARAERLDVTALDLAERLETSEPVQSEAERIRETTGEPAP